MTKGTAIALSAGAGAASGFIGPSLSDKGKIVAAVAIGGALIYLNYSQGGLAGVFLGGLAGYGAAIVLSTIGSEIPVALRAAGASALGTVVAGAVR